MLNQKLSFKISKNKFGVYLFVLALIFGYFNFNYLNFNYGNLIISLVSVSSSLLVFNREFLKDKFFIVSIFFLTCFLFRNVDYYSIYFTTQYFVIISAYFIGKYVGPMDLKRLITILFIVFMIFNVVFYFFYPPFKLESNHYRLLTVMGGPPASSFIFALFSILFYYYRIWSLFALGILLLFLTGNRISILALIISVSFMYLLNNKRYLSKVLIYSFILICLLLIAYYLGIVNKLMEVARVIDENGNLKLGTLKGRLIHWNWAIVHFEKGSVLEKLFGYGINSTKKIFFISHRYNNQYSGSGAMHNEYLRILVENGILGVTILTSLIFSFFKKRNYLSYNNFILGVGVSLLVFITAITDNILYSYNNYLVMAFFLIGYLKNHQHIELEK